MDSLVDTASGAYSIVTSAFGCAINSEQGVVRGVQPTGHPDECLLTNEKGVKNPSIQRCRCRVVSRAHGDWLCLNCSSPGVFWTLEIAARTRNPSRWGASPHRALYEQFIWCLEFRKCPAFCNDSWSPTPDSFGPTGRGSVV